MYNNSEKIIKFFKEEIEPLLREKSTLYKNGSKLKFTSWKNNTKISGNHYFTYQRSYSIDVIYPEETTKIEFSNFNYDVDLIIKFLNPLGFVYQNLIVRGYGDKLYSNTAGFTLFVTYNSYIHCLDRDYKDEEFKHLTKKEIRKRKLDKINKKTRFKWF